MSRADQDIMDLPQIDIAVVGAGPQALTLITHLLQKRPKMRGRVQVFDPARTWLHQWQQQFGAQRIRYLRSPAVHHPAPNPHDLHRFAESRPEDDLLKPYNRPSTALFQEFCQHLIQLWDLADWIRPHRVTRIQSLQPRFRLDLDDGSCVIARRVVVATGSPLIQIPAWAQAVLPGYPPDGLRHSHAVDLRSLPHPLSERILIVGGGLTSGHLAWGALNQGSQATLLCRRSLQERFFDTDPGWLGPKYMKGFQTEPDWNVRLSRIQSARDGGSLTPELMSQLRQAQRSGTLQIWENCQIHQIQWQGSAWQVLCQEEPSFQVDRIWLATGYRFDVRADPLLQDLQQQHPIPVVGGLPVLEEDLCWPGCQLYVMGGLAALHLGPTARNLWGARSASERIVPSLLHPSVLSS